MAKVSKKRWLPWIMILPVILIRGITTVYPVFMTFINSFRNLNVIQGGKGEFIGLQNYARMLSDEKIATSLGFTLIFTMVSMIFHIILGIGNYSAPRLGYINFWSKQRKYNFCFIIALLRKVDNFSM